jgi:hypothetical protein
MLYFLGLATAPESAKSSLPFFMFFMGLARAPEWDCVPCAIIVAGMLERV